MMTGHKVVIFDIDDVLIPWAAVVHKACVEAGLARLDSSWTQWHMWKDYGCSQEDWLRIVDSLVVPNGVYHGEPYPGAVDAVNGLLANGDEVHLVTARGFLEHANEIRAWTKEWKELYFPQTYLHFAHKKGPVAREISATHALDDRIDNVRDMYEVGVDVYLMSQPHNTSTDWLPGRRVNSAAEFVEKIVKDWEAH